MSSGELRTSQAQLASALRARPLSTSSSLQQSDNHLAALPQNNTSRYWLDYTANGRKHSVMFRYLAATVGAEPTSVFITRVATFLTDTAFCRPINWTLLGARFSALGTTFSLPASTPAAAAGLGTNQSTDLPAYWTFIGRSPQGRKFRLFLLGQAYDPYNNAVASDYRITPAEVGAVGTAINNLDGWASLGGTDGLYAIDGLPGTNMYNYVNLGFNSYWQRKARV